MRITNEMLYAELVEIRKQLRFIPLVKWMAAIALFVSLSVLR